MSSADQSLSHRKEVRLSTTDYRIVVVVSQWNDAITESLYAGAIETLLKSGIAKANLTKKVVPGTFELPLMAKWQAERDDVDAVICLGCVVQGETPHFTFICQAAAQGIMDVGLSTGKPVVFGVLTTLTMKQAEDRAGGKHGNKGDEAAVTALEMLSGRA